MLETINDYIYKLNTDIDFFILEVQLQLTNNPYFFEIIIDPYDKMSYINQKDEIIIELIKLYEEKL